MGDAREFEDLAVEIMLAVGDVYERFSLLLDAGTDAETLDSVYLAVRTGVEAWAMVLIGPDDKAAASVARSLLQVAFGGRPPADFWRSSLGQVLIGRGAFPPAPISRAEAAAALQVTHQTVSQHWGRRTLEPYTDPGTRKPTTSLTRQSVMAAWDKRQLGEHEADDGLGRLPRRRG